MNIQRKYIENVPTLRFPEFSEKWEEKKLGALAEFFDHKRIPLKESERQKIKGSFPYYGASGVIDHINKYIFDGEFILLGEDGANIITRSTRLVFLATGKFWVNNHAHIMKAHDSNYFLSEYLETLSYDKYNTGTAQPKLNADICKKIAIKIPQPKEQQKIASFLSSIDEWLENLREQKKSLEKYKKGMMQKIFSQEIRFKAKQGKSFPKWKRKKLGEAAKINPKNNELPEEFIYIDLESVMHGSLLKNNRIKKKNAPSRAQRLLKSGDILFQTVRPYQRNNYYFDSTDNYVASTGYAQIRFETPLFLYQLLHTDQFVNKVLDCCVGTNYPAINSRSLSNIEIFIPSAIEEQERIAEFLNLIDQLIEVKENQIKKAGEWKKGLMQNMFI